MLSIMLFFRSDVLTDVCMYMLYVVYYMLCGVEEYST